MNLSQWRSERKLSLTEAARMVGVSPVAFGRYERGRVPDPPRLQKIIEATEGQVTANDFFDLPTAATQESDRASAG